MRGVNGLCCRARDTMTSSLLSSVCADVSILCAHAECRRHKSVRWTLEFLCNSTSLAGFMSVTLVSRGCFRLASGAPVLSATKSCHAYISKTTLKLFRSDYDELNTWILNSIVDDFNNNPSSSGGHFPWSGTLPLDPTGVQPHIVATGAVPDFLG